MTLYIVLGVLVLAVTFVFLAAATLRTQDAWRTLYNKKKAELADVRQEIRLLKSGEAISSMGEIERSDSSIRATRAELEREMLDRGRVWRNCIRTEFNEDSGCTCFPRYVKIT